jgi:hypothetical protein
VASAGREPVTPSKDGGESPKPLGSIAEKFEAVRERIDRHARRWLARSELLWRFEHRAEIADTFRTLNQFGDTDARMLLLFSDRESFLRVLKQRRIVAKLKSFANIRIEQLPNRDHLLRPLWVQEIFMDRVALELRELRSATEPQHTAPETQHTAPETQHNGTEPQHTRSQPANEGSLAV